MKTHWIIRRLIDDLYLMHQPGSRLDPFGPRIEAACFDSPDLAERRAKAIGHDRWRELYAVEEWP